MKLLVAIALGGAIGAVGRHAVAGQVMKLTGGGFPWGTVTVNVLGSFVMGALIELMALKWSVGQELRVFLTVGILGAFTTFSTFSLDVALLTERGALPGAIGYVLISVLLSIGALFAGLYVFRQLLT
ncbi:MAG: fluoride efflux transporter CrcB [Alphaproteobacteria bacterium]|nr:fluoride efflux transporter CrcB [Alphaproteobacteria bacterium]